MYTLPNQCEFLSEAWFTESRRFLESTVSSQQGALKPFTVSTRFTHAPPHLEFPNDTAVMLVDFEGKTVSIKPGFNESADLVVEGDYQAYLLIAQTVGWQAPGVLGSALSEMHHWFGDNALQTRGSLEDDARKLLGLHHDHMARMTVENPDLAHRAARQGLTKHINEMEDQGYTVIERAITPEFTDQLRDATIRTILSHQSTSLNWMLYHGIEFEKIVQNPLLMTLIDASLGRGAVVASISSIKRGPGKGMIPLHTDYSQVPEPYPEFAVTGVGVWAMEDWTEASGPTWLVPGSHRLRRAPKPGETPDGIPIEMPKGSVVYFQHGVWHWQGERTEPGDRITLHSHFNRGIFRSLEPKKVDVQMLHRNPPRLGEMLGEDDWFDKMTAAGRDHLRMAHMMKLNRFTDTQKQQILQAQIA